MKKIASVTANVVVYIGMAMTSAKGMTLEFSLYDNGGKPNTGAVVVTDLDKSKHEMDGSWERIPDGKGQFCYRYVPYQGKPTRWLSKSGLADVLRDRWLAKRYGNGAIHVDRQGVYHGEKVA